MFAHHAQTLQNATPRYDSSWWFSLSLWQLITCVCHHKAKAVMGLSLACMWYVQLEVNYPTNTQSSCIDHIKNEQTHRDKEIPVNTGWHTQTHTEPCKQEEFQVQVWVTLWLNDQAVTHSGGTHPVLGPTLPPCWPHLVGQHHRLLIFAYSFVLHGTDRGDKLECCEWTVSWCVQCQAWAYVEIHIKP